MLVCDKTAKQLKKSKKLLSKNTVYANAPS